MSKQVRKVSRAKKSRDVPWRDVFLMASWHETGFRYAHEFARACVYPMRDRKNVRLTWAVANGTDIIDVPPQHGTVNQCFAAMTSLQSTSEVYVTFGQRGSMGVWEPCENGPFRIPHHTELRCNLKSLALFEYENSAIDFVLNYFRIAASTGSCICACAHADSYHEMSGGWLYSQYPFEPDTLQRGIRLHSWVEMICDERQRVRDVVWANLIGPRMAEKLSPTIVEEFNSQAAAFTERRFNRRKKVIEHFNPIKRPMAYQLENGCLAFFLSEDPRDNCIRPNLLPPADDTAYLQLGVWLHREFRRAGIV